jgi:hypothetical protein
MSVTPNEDGTFAVIINNPYGHWCETDTGPEYWRGIGNGEVVDDDLVVTVSYACGDEQGAIVESRYVAESQNNVIRQDFDGGHILHRLSCGVK